jgi:hypothetical protein
MRSRTVRARVAAVGLWSTLAALPVFAAPVSAAPPAADATRKEEYEVAIAAALKAFDRGDFAQAYRHFSVAHGLIPSARTLRGMGLAAYQMGDFATAATRLRAALAAEVSPLPAKMRNEASAMLDHARDKTGTVDLVLTPADAEVLIDGAHPEESAHFFVAPGTHVLEVRSGAHTSKTTELHLGPGERFTVKIELQALAPPATPPRPPLVPMMPAIAIPPKHIHLRLLGDNEKLTFWQQDLAAPSGFRRLCQVPCAVDVPPGMVMFGLTVRDDPPHLPNALFVETNAIVRGDYREVGGKRIFRAIGWSLLAAGVGLTGYGAIGTTGSTREALVLTGIIPVFVGGIFVLVGSGDDIAITSVRSQPE